MSERKLIKPALCTGIIAMASMTAIASAAEPTAAELRQQIDAMQQQINQIEARETAAKEQQTTAVQVLEDANRRSQMLQTGGITGGFDGKEFFIGSADGNFKLVPFFQFQFRSVTNYGEDTKTDGDDETDDEGSESIESGVEVRRMKFGFKGNAFSKALKYEFRWATARSGGGLTLENAFVQYALSSEWGVKIGQWKDNVFHEEWTSSSRQIAVDRSMVNEELGGGQTDYTQGIALLYTIDAFRAEVALTDGANTDNTDFQDGGGGPFDIDPNYGISFRGEYKVMGDWKSYDDFSAMKNKEDLLVIGGGANYTEGGDSYVLFHTIDAQWEGSGMPLSVYAAYLGTYGEDGDDDTYNWGGLVQVAYMIDDKWEIFGRAGFVDFDDADSFQEYTIGGNYYFHGHNAKATLDVVVLPDGTPGADTGIGYLEGDDFQAVLRAQFQLAL